MQEEQIQQVPDTVYLSFNAEIVPATTESLIAAMTNYATLGVQTVHLLLSTPGGDVMNGITIYNILRGLPIHFVTHNVGQVDSIGNVIFLAGDERYACPQATFMFHGVSLGTVPGERLEGKALRERLGRWEAAEQRIAAIIADRTQLQEADITDLFLEERTKDAAYAAGCGIIDEVRDIDIPAGSAVQTLVFQRQPLY